MWSTGNMPHNEVGKRGYYEKENDIKEIIECLKALEGIKKKLLNVILKEEKKNG